MPKILVIRFSSIGDIVLTTPVLRCIRMQTGSEVHFLTKESFRSVVEHNPHVSRVHTIRKKVSEVLPALRSEGFDFVVDLHRNLRSWQVKSALGVPSKSFDKLNWEKWLLVNIGINRLPKLHIVDRYLAAAAPLGVQNDGLGLDYFIPESDEVAAKDFLAGHFGVHIPAFIALVTGTALIAHQSRSKSGITRACVVPLSFGACNPPSPRYLGPVVTAYTISVPEVS